MSERVETVRLTANISNYLAGMQTARTATLKLANDSTARLALQRQALTDVGLAVGAVGAITLAAVALSVAKWAEFDQAMSNVKAVTQETATNMDLLRTAALDAGGATVFTAVEAANAIEELGKNGLTTQQILGGGLTGALALAASGQLEVARAAEVAAITMKQFKLTGDQIPHVADLLAAGAGKAAGDVEDLAQALAQAGLVAAGTGLTVEETTGILAAFADAGLIGSDAGTSLKTALQRLTPISGESQKAMEDLNFSAYDMQGNFIGAANLAGLLRDRLGELSVEQRNAALAQIFGTDAVRAAQVLYEQGAEGIQKYIDQTNDSGYAAKVAADRLDNLKGDIEKLGGAWDTFLIRQGSPANDVLRTTVQSLTYLVDIVGQAPEPLLATGLAIATVAGAIALTGGAALAGIPKYAAFREGLDTLQISGRLTGLAIAGVGAAIGLATLIVSAYVQRAAEAQGRTDALADSFDKATGAVTGYTRELVAKNLQEIGAFDKATELGIAQADLVDAILDGADAFEFVSDAIEKNNISQQEAAYISADLVYAIGTTNSELENARAAWENTSAATKTSTDELGDFEGQTNSARDSLNELAAAIRDFGSAELDMREANRRIEQSLDDFSAAVTENGATFDINTEQGRDNQAALDDIATAYLNAAAAAVIQTGAAEASIPVLEAGRQMFIDQAIAAGINADEAARLADKLGLIPENVNSAINVDTAEADRRIQNTLNLLRGLPMNYDITVGVGTVLKPGFKDGGYTGDIPTRAVAGFVHGREFVSTAATTAVPENRRALEYMHRGGTIRGYFSGGYVDPVNGPSAVRGSSFRPFGSKTAGSPADIASRGTGPNLSVTFVNPTYRDELQELRQETEMLVQAMWS